MVFYLLFKRVKNFNVTTIQDHFKNYSANKPHVKVEARGYLNVQKVHSL